MAQEAGSLFQSFTWNVTSSLQHRWPYTVTMLCESEAAGWTLDLFCKYVGDGQPGGKDGTPTKKLMGHCRIPLFFLKS
jgi:hypothetical protein